MKTKDTRLLPKKYLSSKRALMKPSVDLIIVNVRSRFNVGSMFRTADAAGIRKIYLCGYTPSPPHKEINKVSLGAEKTVKFEISKSPLKTIRKLSKRGVEIVALETGGKSLPYYKFKRTSSPIALVVGNEIDGLPKDILNLCDYRLQIPMRGKKESLNVGIALGIVAYRIAFP